MICPLCHKPHDDPPDIDAGRVRVCLNCHPPTVKIPPKRKPPRRKAQPPPPSPADDTGTAAGAPSTE
ncbi:hypothetical protein ES703_49226 [subsurface metagenome]